MTVQERIPEHGPGEVRIEAKCKQCGGPIAAYAAGDCPEEWVQKLKALLSCDTCSRRRELFRQARDTVYAMAKRLEESKETAPAHWDWIRNRLLTATRDYCSAVAASLGMSTAPWSEDLADAIMEHPSKAGLVLSQIVKSIRQAKEAESK